MDKDSVILKYQKTEVEGAASGLDALKERTVQQCDALDDLQAKMNRIYELTGKQPPLPVNVKSVSSQTHIDVTSTSQNQVSLSYEELFQKASSSLIARGLDVESLDYHSLVSASELSEIEKELNRALPRREKWVKGDFVAVFVAAAIGSLADIILSGRDNPLTGTHSEMSKWLNQFHQHEGGGPIDYQGAGFGGGFHRELSKGHDILRFIEAIMMFKSGQFVGVRYNNGVASTVVSAVNQYGTPYEQLGMIEAIVRYAKHMFADLFSTYSLPFPGSSFLVESGNRELRKLSADMYRNGFNLKNVMLQSLSTIIVEVILRLYFSVQAVRAYKDEFELSEDYSNFETVKRFFRPENDDKLKEMLLVAHSIVTAVNIGKVVINKAPWEINVTEIFSVVRYGANVLSRAIERNSEYAKLIRNANEAHEGWLRLEESLCADEALIVHDTSKLIIA